MKIQGVFVGIDTYRDDQIRKLQCAARDALELSELFQAMGADVRLLRNTLATADQIRRALAMLARLVSQDDTAVFYFSGHGGTERLLRRGGKSEVIPFLIPYDADAANLAGSAIRMREILDYLEHIPCDRVIFLFDSCYSGAAANARTFEIPGVRGAERGSQVLQGPIGNGVVIFAASKEYEPAYEDPSDGHGVFTGCVIEALSGKAKASAEGEISLNDVFKYVHSNVLERSKRRFPQEQCPIWHVTEERPILFPVVRSSPIRTLASFPYHFLPLTIVVGDRRELDPKTQGDFFALSASPAELRWLLRLDLPRDVEIIPDKVLRKASSEFLAERYGTRNLLIIGSPAVNLTARLANETSLFPFMIDPSVCEQFERISMELDRIADNPTRLVNFAADPSNREHFRYYMNQYRKGGFIDPTYAFGSRGETIPHNKDYGVVTICRNPYSRAKTADVLAVLAAGVHLPGTMYALDQLADAQANFKDKPFGGVFSLTLTQEDWITRMERAQVQWSTEPYDAAAMLRGLQRLKEKRKFPNLTEAGIDDRIELVRLLSGIEITRRATAPLPVA